MRNVNNNIIDSDDEIEFTSSFSSKTLVKAASNGNIAVVRSLLAIGVNVDDQDESGKTSLIYAAKIGHVDMVDILLKAGAKLGIQDRYKRTALVYAVQLQRYEVAHRLVSEGIDVNIKDSGGRAALYYAVSDHRIDLISHLIENGANVNTMDGYNRTVLWHAVQKDFSDIVKILVDNNADADTVDANRTLLMRAIEYGYTKTACHLIGAQGLNINYQNESNRTALILAAKTAQIAVVQELITAGVNLDATDNGGRTALMYAVVNGHDAVAQKLIDAKSNLDAVDNDGRTALMFAVVKGYHFVAQKLIAAGADKTIKDNIGKTALVYAILKDNLVIFLLLEQEFKDDIIKAVLEANSIKIVKHLMYSGAILGDGKNIDTAIERLKELCEYVPSNLRDGSCYKLLTKTEVEMASLNTGNSRFSSYRINLLAAGLCGVRFTKSLVTVYGRMSLERFRQVSSLMSIAVLGKVRSNVNEYVAMHSLFFRKAMSSLPIDLKVSILDFILVGGIKHVISELKAIEALELPMPESSQSSMLSCRCEDSSNKKTRLEKEFS